MIIKQLVVEYADERIWVGLNVLADFIVTVTELLDNHIHYSLV